LNTGELTESIEHFDCALEHLGEHVAHTPTEMTIRFVRSMVPILYQVFVRPARHRTGGDVAHEREVFELFYYRGRAEVTSNPRRLFLELPMMLRRFNRVDPRQIDQACSMYVSCAAIFAYSGKSFGISSRMLGVARTLIREGNVTDAFVYREAEF